jgi:hypothetical protein
MPQTSKGPAPQPRDPGKDGIDESEDSIDELIEVWEDPAISLDDKLLRTFSGLKGCLPRPENEDR